MATLIVRNLDDDLVGRLHSQAAEHGRSAEAEHHEILRSTLGQKKVVSDRADIATRLAAFRKRTARRGSATSQELLDATRHGLGHTPEL